MFTAAFAANRRYLYAFPKMAFLAQLERVASAVEASLDRLLPLSQATAPEQTGLGQAMRYAALGGGKRLRPFLLIESAHLFGVEAGRCASRRLRARMRPLLLSSA